MSQLCSVCGSPRKTAGPTCPFCDTLFAGEDASAIPGVGAEVLAALDRGDLIGAVKLYKTIHKVGLVEAKKAVDAIFAERKR